jgi:hypothetical protein
MLRFHSSLGMDNPGSEFYNASCSPQGDRRTGLLDITARRAAVMVGALALNLPGLGSGTAITLREVVVEPTIDMIGGVFNGIMELLVTEAGAATNECFPRPGTGTMIMGSDSYTNNPGVNPGDIIVISGVRVQIVNAGGGKFWTVCIDQDAAGSSVSTARPEDSPRDLDEKPPVTDVLQRDTGSVDDVVVSTPTVAPKPAPTTTTTPKPVKVVFKGTELDAGDKTKEEVGKDTDTVVVIGLGDGSYVMSNSELPLNLPSDPVPEPVGPLAIAPFSSTSDGSKRRTRTSNLVGSLYDPLLMPDSDGSRTSASFELDPDLFELKGEILTAINSGSADGLVEFIKTNQLFNPTHEDVPGANDSFTPTRMLPNSEKLKGLILYAFDPDVTDRKRYSNASTIAAILLTAHQYQIAVNGMQEFKEFKGSCLRIGDLSARDGHKTHDGNEVDLTSQMDCPEQTDPGDGPVGVYLLGEDGGLDANPSRESNNPRYSPELNRALLDFLKRFNLEDGQLVERVLFNDPEAVASGLTHFVVNHASHWHVETNPADTGDRLKNWAVGGAALSGDNPTAEHVLGWSDLWYSGDVTGNTSAISASRVPIDTTEGNLMDDTAIQEVLSRTPEIGDSSLTTYPGPENIRLIAQLPQRLQGYAEQNGVDVIGGALIGDLEPSEEDLRAIGNVRDMYRVFAPLIREESDLRNLGLSEEVIGYMVAQFWLESGGEDGLSDLAFLHKNFAGNKQGGVETVDNESVQMVDRGDGPSTFVSWDHITGSNGFLEDWITQRIRVSPGLLRAGSIDEYAGVLRDSRYATSTSYGEGLRAVHNSLFR